MTLLNLQFERINRNRVTFLLIVITAIVTLICGYLADKLLKSIAYLFAMWLCSIVIDIYANRKITNSEVHVKKPALETLFIVVFLILALVFLYVRYMGPYKWENFNGITKLCLAPLLFLFAFPMALAATMLILRYRFKELGFRLQGLLLALPVLIITAGTAFIFARKDFTITAVLNETGGIGGFILEGFICAALMEEFWRYIAQTRFGALFKNGGMGWFVASVIWALMHVPTFYSQGGNIGLAFLGALSKIPLGLMWGYLTYRTKSILPSIIVHGLNVWGLQNF